MPFVKRQRKYYKDVYQDWTQPVLTANGELGGTSFACFVGSNCSGNPAYYAFDGKDTTAWASNLTNTQDYIGFYNPNPLLVSEIVCTNKSWITGLWEVYGSNNNRDYELIASGENTDATDGSTFTIDLSSNEKPYKYYKIQCLTTLANQRVGMGEIKITAQELMDIIEVPSSSITDFGSYKYFKNVVTTKYWKEITTGSKELEYACYSNNGSYAYATKDLKIVKVLDLNMQKVTDSNNLTMDVTSFCRNITIDSLEYNFAAITGGSYWFVFSRSYNDDLYIDTTVTETVEGTPEDYTYTTEEVVPVEVAADEDYDYTEFVPSTQFDNYEDKNKLYAPTRRIREYYKYGTEPNATVVGIPTINEGVVSGFTTANYLSLPKTFNPENNPWEFVTKFNLANNTTNQRIFGSNGNIYGLSIQVDTSGKLDLYASTNGSSWNLMLYKKGTTTLAVNTDYWLKFEYTGSAYVTSLSTDGKEWTVEASVDSTSRLYNFGTAYIGANLTSVGFSGSIDLNESYIKINDEMWWHGTKIVKSTEDDYEWYEDRNVAYDIRS